MFRLSLTFAYNLWIFFYLVKRHFRDAFSSEIETTNVAISSMAIIPRCIRFDVYFKSIKAATHYSNYDGTRKVNVNYFKIAKTNTKGKNYVQTIGGKPVQSGRRFGLKTERNCNVQDFYFVIFFSFCLSRLTLQFDCTVLDR